MANKERRDKIKFDNLRKRWYKKYGQYLIELNDKNEGGYDPFRYVSAEEIQECIDRKYERELESQMSFERSPFAKGRCSSIPDRSKVGDVWIPILKDNNYCDIDGYISQPGYFRVQKLRPKTQGSSCYDTECFHTVCAGGIPLHSRNRQMTMFMYRMEGFAKKRSMAMQLKCERNHAMETEQRRRLETLSIEPDIHTEQFFNTLVVMSGIKAQIRK